MKRRERVCRGELPIEVQVIPKARVCNWQMLDERAVFSWSRSRRKDALTRISELR